MYSGETEDGPHTYNQPCSEANCCGEYQTQAMAIHTNEVKECETDQQIGSPVEAVAEGKGSASYVARVDLTENKPRHCGRRKQSRGTG